MNQHTSTPAAKRQAPERVSNRLGAARRRLLEPASRRGFLLALLVAGTVPALQGCFPIVAGGAVVGASIASDRRTSGAVVEDEGIEWKTANRLRERFGDAIHVNVTSFNRNVLLTGEAPNDATRAELERIAAGVENVRGVVNEVQVAGNSSLSSRGNDGLITSKVKARFLDMATFGVQHVKVVTEAGTVFLMGLVTRREADGATDIARTTTGVRKVVRVFEYISEDEALRLQRSGGAKPASAQPANGGATPAGSAQPGATTYPVQ